VNFTSRCPVFISDSKGWYLFHQVSFENNIEWFFRPSFRCSRHLEIIWDKLPKLLDRHPNGVTLFVWLGTWQCHTIILSSSLTSVVRSLPLFTYCIFRPSSFNYLKFEVVRKDVMKRKFKLWYSWVITHLTLNNNQSINIVCKPW
jgi:hypothetical protein